MNTNFVKPVILTTVGVGTTFAVTTALSKTIERVAPNTLVYVEGMDRKETAIYTAKVLGVAIGVSLLATVIATKAQSIVEDAIWHEESAN